MQMLEPVIPFFVYPDVSIDFLMTPNFPLLIF